MGKEAKYVVRLTPEERQTLQAMVDKGHGAADKLLRARVFLKADVSEAGPGWTDEAIADAFEVGASTVHRLRQRLVEEGLDAALLRKPQSTRPPAKLDGAQEARLIAIACSEPPTGRARWTLQLLADKLVELKVVDSISDETVRQRLKKTTSSLGCAANG
jgi:transposase